MPARRSTYRAAGARSGLTLMEMLLVLALMVAIASLASPAFRRPIENFRLRKGGDAVRIAFTRARIRAMKSGQTHLFRYQVGGNAYVVELWRADDAYLEAGTEIDVSQTQPLAPTTQPLAGGDTEMTGTGVQETLPEGVTFHGGLIEADMRGAMELSGTNANGGMGNQTLQSTPLPGAPTDPLGAQSDWSQPLLFYPDGSTSDAKVLLVNRNVLFVRIELRGLTGIAKSTDVLDQNELELANAAAGFTQ